MTELLSENTNMLNISVVVCYPSLKVNECGGRWQHPQWHCVWNYLIFPVLWVS